MPHAGSRTVSLVLAACLLAVALGAAPPAAAQPSVITTIPLDYNWSVGGAAANPVTNRIYVVGNQGWDSVVWVIDGDTNLVVDTIAVGFSAFGVVFLAHGVAVNPVTNRIYVDGLEGNEHHVLVIDGATNTLVARVLFPWTGALHTRTSNVAVNPVTNRIYRANYATDQGNSVWVIDGGTNTVVATVPVGLGSYGVAVNPVTNRVYVADYRDDNVSVIDGDTNMVVATVPVGHVPSGVSVNPVTNRIYATSRVDIYGTGEGSNSVWVIDGDTNTVIATVPAGDQPFGVAVNPATNRIYVANLYDDNVSVVDGASNMVVATVPVGDGPLSVAVNPVTNRIYVVNYMDNTVSVIEDARQVVLFIKGINTNSSCDIDGWSAIRDTLKTTLGMSDSDFLEYDYTSADTTAQGCGADNHFANFTEADTCWSLNDTFRNNAGETFSLTGQGERLASFLDQYLSANPNAKVSIVGWSQGGLLAVYTLRTFASQYPSLGRIDSVVTLDSPLRGIGSFGAGFFRKWFTNCGGLDNRYDSTFDMEPSADVVQLINSSNPTHWPRTLTVNETGNDSGIQLVDGNHSTVDWATDRIDVHTGNHGTVWNGSGDVGQQRVLQRFITCAIGNLSPAGRCSEYARDTSRTVPSHDYLIQTREVPSETSTAYFRSEWSGSTVATSLVSPSSRVIDANTTAADVQHRSGTAWEQFEITGPEPGQWTVRMYGEDVPAEGEQTYSSFAAVPSATVDQDADGVRDSADNCLSVWNPSQSDADQDGAGDACDPDNDNDGVANASDNCEFVANPDQTDANQNGFGDSCDPALRDSDSDSVLDGVDNCPFVPNADQRDTNQDGIGDACESSASVGGMAVLPDVGGSDASARTYALLILLAAVAVGTLTVGAWYARRRRAR